MSSQFDSIHSSAGKRARTDGSRREDDWTCPSCGNVNFSFRTTCNMRNCTQSRPAEHNTKSAPKPLHIPPAYTASSGYMGSGSPPSMYMGAPPYGGSIFGRSSLPSYDFPFSGGSGYGYGYGGRVPVGSPYGPLHLSGPPPYSSGSMMGAGGMYGMPPIIDRYGLGMPVGHGATGARLSGYPDENSPKKTAGRENDWTCPNCGNRNFAFRTVCNMRKCNTPRPESQAHKFDNSKGSKTRMPEGSWKCEKCNNINYPFRTKCNRQNCGAEKPSDQNESTGAKSEEEDQAGTWEEKNLNTWATNRIKELLLSLGCMEFSKGKADIHEVSNCVGDAFLVTVRNKKRVGYTFEVTLRFKGEWMINEEKKKIDGYLDVPEFTFGELEDLQIDVRIREDKDLAGGDGTGIINDMKSILPAIREKLLKFEQELKDR